MVIVRGVNLYPTAVEQIIREHAEIAEYRVALGKSGVMDEIAITIEPADGCATPAALAATLESELRRALGLRIPVSLVRVRRTSTFRDEGQTMGAPVKPRNLCSNWKGVSKDYGAGDVLQ